MRLPKNLEFIISRLNASGHRADIVGGCVRDFMLGKIPNDYDVTTDATPDELREIFSDLRTVDTGIKHGTLTVIIDSEPYEVTTYRKDGTYSDNRHPDSVSFTRDLHEDLSRRDFTVNAMCYNSKDGVTDIFSGREDLSAGIIRAVGDPEKRFREDALRILRALRFAATLDFVIEPNTARAIFNTAHLLAHVSAERVFSEWKKLISGVGAHRILSDYIGVIAEVIPEISSTRLCDSDRFAVSDALTRELSLFFNAGGTPTEKYNGAMLRLKSDNLHRQRGLTVLENIDFETDTERALRHLLIKAGEVGARGVVSLKYLLGRADAGEMDMLGTILSGGFCYRLADMKISGNDIAALGFSGREIGRELQRLLYMIADGEVENEREALISKVTEKS